MYMKTLTAIRSISSVMLEICFAYDVSTSSSPQPLDRAKRPPRTPMRCTQDSLATGTHIGLCVLAPLGRDPAAKGSSLLDLPPGRALGAS